MSGWITFNRDFFDKDKVKARYNTKIPWTVRSVFRELVWEAYYEPGIFKGVQMQRGDVCISVEALCERLNLSPRSCRSALEVLINNRQVTDKQPTNQPTNRSKFYRIENYDDIVIPETNRQTNRQVTDKQPTTINRSKEVKEVDQNLKTMSADADVSVPEGDLFPNPNGKARAEEIQVISAHYKTKIHDKAKLTLGSKTKIRVRLNTYSKDELMRAIDNFSGDAWWMERNGRRGMEWFFKNDERIEQLVNLIPRSSHVETQSPLVCPEHGPMKRENVAGKITYFCKQFKEGCPNVYRSEVVWTDRLQTWEMGNRA